MRFCVLHKLVAFLGLITLTCSISFVTASAFAEPFPFAALPENPTSFFDPMSRERNSASIATRSDSNSLPSHLRKSLIQFRTREAPGTIIIDPLNTHLYLILGDGKALRYGIGVGREGFTWSGVETISRMAEWPDWTPPTAMIARQPYLPRFVAGGPGNPLGARALYLGATAYRIHGTNEPSTIGQHVSSGCIRMTNEDMIDLYRRVKIGSKVIVLNGNHNQPSFSQQSAINRAKNSYNVIY